ncbi:hypothetical protein A3C26_04045 [Candidatus Daviesbacteria bacterium RIFCSPHIGHO2_02_FULL_39_12]|uniref:Uncharacterized protein n=1 Tax=Candidatus Daviesbacteria bacterium RIFCSPHIGHO2_02_FULL_39_12 TaxID=1797770 RepID=A0A1F5J9G3_9BACT|nr:MAG: hypothetical protein A3C26_04045 [Candidatus Daviesbacteria bacterium RIFCSPHIGHO2_02_FULL_39_12]
MIKTSYSDQPCERCGSKKAIIIIDKVITAVSARGAKIEYSQIVCTNIVCQKEFDSKLAEKIQKNEAIKLKRAEEKAARKAQSKIL